MIVAYAHHAVRSATFLPVMARSRWQVALLDSVAASRSAMARLAW
jgi:hypothetical protein